MLKYFMFVLLSCSMRGLFADVGEARALALFLLAQLRGELGAEILGFEDLADLDLAIAMFERPRTAPDPLDRLFERLALPEPEARDELLGFGERTIDDGARIAREFDARPGRARLESFACEHHAGLHQLFVEAHHVAEQLLAGHLARFAVLRRPHHHAESHVRFSCCLVEFETEFPPLMEYVERPGLESTGSKKKFRRAKCRPSPGALRAPTSHGGRGDYQLRKHSPKIFIAASRSAAGRSA